MTTSDVLTLLVAIYAAVVSTILAAREYRKDKPRIKVECGMVLSAAPQITMAPPSVMEFVEIRVVNIGYRPIQIVAAELRLSNGYQFTQAQNKLERIPLPKKLEEGDSVSIKFDFPKVQEVLWDFQKKAQVKYTSAFVRDAAGNNYETDLPMALEALLESRNRD